MNSFLRTTDLLSRGLDAASLRYDVSANNLANSEVPHFKRTDVNFESELKAALDSEIRAKSAFQMTRTNDRHIPVVQPVDYRSVEPRRVLDYVSTVKANGNNVDSDEEAMLVLKTQMQYQMLAMLQGFEYSQIRSVLK